MTPRFEPRLDLLPPAQREFWPQLRPAATLSFVLYGGTAVALLLGHRASLDFDLVPPRMSPLRRKRNGSSGLLASGSNSPGMRAAQEQDGARCSARGLRRFDRDETH
jgi:hypothetical protein